MNGRYIPWILLSLFCFVVSLGKFPGTNIQVPSLVFPLEQLRDLKYPLVCACLGGLLYYTFTSTRSFFSIPNPKAFEYLLLLQIVVFIKNITYGDINTALLTIAVYILFLEMMTKGIMKFLYRDGFDIANLSMAMSGAIFVTLNFYQSVQNSYAVSFVNGQFLGTTNNPQMAAITLVPTVPCLLFQMEKQALVWWKKAFYAVVLCLVLYFIWWTASRTGFIMAVASIVFFYRTKQGALFRVSIVVALAALAVMPLLQPDTPIGLSGGLTMAAKLQEGMGRDTRTDVWTRLLSLFLKDPLFGAPLEGDRIGFGENSWLSVAATTGIMGLLPLLLFGFECLKTIGAMLKISRKMPALCFHCSVVIAGIAGLLVGSFAEAYLVGILTAPITALCLFLILGQYLIDVYRHHTAPHVN